MAGQDIQFGIRITADNQVFVDGVKASKDQVDELAKGLKQVGEDAEGAGVKVDGLAGEIFKGVTAADAAKQAIGFLADQYARLKDLTMEAQQVNAALGATINATGRAGTDAKERIEALADAMQKTTRFDDEGIKRAGAQLMGFSSLTTSQIERILSASANYTTIYGGTIEANATMIAKSIVETGNSFGQLERKLGDFDPAIKKTILALKDQGDTVAAGNLLLDEFSGRVGPAAEEAYSGLTRRTEGAKKAWDELLESMGAKIFDEKNKEAGFLETTFRKLQESIESTTTSWEKFKRMAGASAGFGPDGSWGISNGFGPGAMLFGGTEALDAAGARSVKVDTLEETRARNEAKAREDARARTAAENAAKAEFDKIAERYDRQKAMAKELADVQVRGAALVKAGLLEQVEVEKTLAAIREKYGRKDAADDARRERAEKSEALKIAREEEKLRREMSALLDRDAAMTERIQNADQKRLEGYTRGLNDLARMVEFAEEDQALMESRKEDVEYVRQVRAATLIVERAMVGASDDQIARLKQELEEAKNRLAVVRESAKVTNDAIASAKAAAKEAKEELRDYEQATEAIGNALTRAIADGFAGAKGAARNFLRDLAAIFGNTVLKTYVQPVMKDLAGRVLGGGLGGMFGGGLQDGDLPDFGNGPRLGWNSWGNTGGYNVAGGNLSFAGVANGAMIGGAFGNIAGQAFGNARNQEGMGIGGTVGGAIGSIWGPLGAMIGSAIGTAIGSLFKSGGGPKTGGSSNVGFDAFGRPTGSVAVPGSDNGRFFTPSGADSQLAGMTGNVATGFFGLLEAMGGKASGPVTFGMGFDTDPDGTAPNRISSGVTVGGRRVFGSQDRDVGRDPDALASELKLESSRMILAALQESELPASVAAIIDSVNVAGATQEAIDNILALASAFGDLSKVTEALDPEKLIADARRGPMESFRAMGESLTALAGRSRMTAADVQTLTGATANFRQAAAQMILQFEQAKINVGAMFGDTARGIKMTGLDDQARYNFLQSEADSLLGRIGASTSSDEIERLSGQINQNISEAFNLLDPAQQEAMRAEYLERIEKTNAAIQARLEKVQAAAAEEANKVLKSIQETMDKAAAAMTSAATSVQAGGTAIANAAAEGVNVKIVISDERVTLQVNEG